MLRVRGGLQAQRRRRRLSCKQGPSDEASPVPGARSQRSPPAGYLQSEHTVPAERRIPARIQRHRDFKEGKAAEHKTPWGWSGKGNDWQRPQSSRRRAGEARWPAAPRNPQCARLSPGAAGFPQKGAFSGNIQKFNLSQQRKACWIVQWHKGTVFPQEREVLRLEHGSFTPAQKPPERNHGVIEAGSQSETCLKGRKQGKKRFCLCV